MDDINESTNELINIAKSIVGAEIAKKLHGNDKWSVEVENERLINIYRFVNKANEIDDFKKFFHAEYSVIKNEYEREHGKNAQVNPDANIISVCGIGDDNGKIKFSFSFGDITRGATEMLIEERSVSKNKNFPSRPVIQPNKSDDIFKFISEKADEWHMDFPYVSWSGSLEYFKTEKLKSIEQDYIANNGIVKKDGAIIEIEKTGRYYGYTFHIKGQLPIADPEHDEIRDFFNEIFPMQVSQFYINSMSKEALENAIDKKPEILDMPRVVTRDLISDNETGQIIQTQKDFVFPGKTRYLIDSAKKYPELAPKIIEACEKEKANLNKAAEWRVDENEASDAIEKIESIILNCSRIMETYKNLQTIRENSER